MNLAEFRIYTVAIDKVIFAPLLDTMTFMVRSAKVCSKMLNTAAISPNLVSLQSGIVHGKIGHFERCVIGLVTLCDLSGRARMT